MGDSGTHGGMTEAIRQAFASGRSADGEDLLAAALEAGVPWDVATRAVAEGVARRFEMPSAPSSEQNRVPV